MSAIASDSPHLDSLHFKDNAKLALADANLQKALAGMDDTFVAYRARAVEQLPEFELSLIHI